MISRSVLAAVQQAPTATAMARLLLVAIFDSSTLLVSNLKGGVTKRPGAEDSTHRLCKLDETKLEAISCELL